ncbi:MAG: hypothetical protein ACM3MK_14425 [Chitinophagales bacterium]
MYHSRSNLFRTSIVLIITFIFSILYPLFPLKPAIALEQNQEKTSINRKDRVELPDYRTANSKRFINPDGTMTEEVNLDNIHYKKNGRWEDIDNTLIPTQDGDYTYTNKANRFKVQFSDKTNSNQLTSFSIGNYKLEMRPLGLLINSGKVNGNKISYSQGAEPAPRLILITVSEMKALRKI